VEGGVWQVLIFAQDAQAHQEQVNAKIHWDAPDDEVLDWLEEKHCIVGPEAEAMLAIAWEKRRWAIRERGLYLMILSGIGMGLLAVSLGLDLTDLKVVILLCTLGFLFLKGLARVLSGKTDVPIDS
jgi:hypothetical protein